MQEQGGGTGRGWRNRASSWPDVPLLIRFAQVSLRWLAWITLRRRLPLGLATARPLSRESVSFVLKPKQLAKTEPLTALKRIQTQLSALYPEKKGYVLVEFSEPLDDDLQAVLVYSCDVPRMMALAVEVGIYAAPAYESLLVANEAAED